MDSLPTIRAPRGTAILALIILALLPSPPEVRGGEEAPAAKKAESKDPSQEQVPAPAEAKKPPEKAGAPDEKPQLPWEPGKEYRFTWVNGRTKVGETRFKISEVDAPTGSPVKKLLQSSSKYWFRKEGVNEEGQHQTSFSLSLRPIRYKASYQMSGLGPYRSQHVQEGRMQGRTLVFFTTFNNDPRTAVENKVEAPPEAYLWVNQAFDNWALLVGQLLRKPGNCDAKVIYPDLLRVYDIRFTDEGEEALDLGKKEKHVCRRYSFRSPEGQVTGRIWVDARGRLLQHVQEPLRIYLED